MQRKISLQKTNARNKIQLWKASVSGDTATYSWGQENGEEQKLIQTYQTGKQGRSASEQAWFEAEATAKKKRRMGYSDRKKSPGSSSQASMPMAESSSSRPVEEVKTESVSPLPMLAKEFESKKLVKARKMPVSVWAQPKLDGVRCLGDTETGQLWSRTRVRLLGLDHIEKAILGLKGKIIVPSNGSKSCVRWLDGELWAPGIGFQTITSLVRRTKGPAKDAARIEYHVYDVVDPNAGFTDRYMSGTFDILSGLDGPVKSVQTESIKLDQVSHLHDVMVAKGYEGLMVRIPESRYEMGKRSTNLLKVKLFKDEEYACVGIKKAELEDTVGSLELRMADGRTFHATPAMKDEEKQELWQHRERCIGQLVTVKYFEKTDVGIPRFPVAKGIRSPDDR